MEHLPRARFRAKLSDSLVDAGRGVNTQFPFGVLVFKPLQVRNEGCPAYERGTSHSMNNSIRSGLLRRSRAISLRDKSAERLSDATVQP